MYYYRPCQNMFLCCNWKYYFPLHHVFPNFYAGFFVPHNESGCWPVDWSKKVCIYICVYVFYVMNSMKKSSTKCNFQGKKNPRIKPNIARFGKNIGVSKLCTRSESKQTLLLTLFHKVLHSGPGGEHHCLKMMVLKFFLFRGRVWYWWPFESV